MALHVAFVNIICFLNHKILVGIWAHYVNADQKIEKNVLSL